MTILHFSSFCCNISKMSFETLAMHTTDIELFEKVSEEE